MPRWAAPNATKVATSNERTRMMSRSGWLVVKRSWRESGSAKAFSGSILAATSSGAASLRMRPLGTARISFSFSPLDTTIAPVTQRPARGSPPPETGSVDWMGGLPWGGPRLPDIPQMARETADFQPYGAIGGKTQGHQVFFRRHGQQFQHPVGLLERDLVMVDRIHLVEDQR